MVTKFPYIAIVALAFAANVTKALVLNVQTNDAAVVSRINARFSNGRPSKDLKAAGVVVRGFDEKTDSPQSNNMPPWLPLRGDTDDRISASLMNSRTPYMFFAEELGLAGFVISPEAATAMLRCSYEGDGFTDGMERCDSKQASADCVPGCMNQHQEWCNINSTETYISTNTRCAWPPTAVDAMMNRQEHRVAGLLRDCDSPFQIVAMEHHCRCVWSDGNARSANLYNELILDPVMLSQRLPSAIEAIYFVKGPCSFAPHRVIAGEEAAKAMQKLFADHFGQHVPLMQVTSFEQDPFELYSA